jgi:hypothetical protein
MRKKAEYDDQLVIGLSNIARVVEGSPATVSREAERGVWPCVTINSVMLANRQRLLAAKAAREAARGRDELLARERKASGSKQRRAALEPAREMEEAV